VLLPIVQVLAVASGALPVFWLARKHLGSPRAAAHFDFAYLLYPATQFNAFTSTSSFHSVAIAVPLVLFAIWFLDEDRLVAFSAVALLACTTKEEIPLAVGCLGIWYAVRTGRRLFGLSVFGVGLAITLFNFLWVIPHFSQGGGSPFAGRYTAVGGTPGGIAHKLFSDPDAFVHEVATGHKALYLVLLLVPFLGLWLLEPLLFLGAVPDLTINPLSNKTDRTSIPFRWTAGIVPFVVAAGIFGAARFQAAGGSPFALGDGRRGPPRRLQSVVLSPTRRADPRISARVSGSPRPQPHAEGSCGVGVQSTRRLPVRAAVQLHVRVGSGEVDRRRRARSDLHRRQGLQDSHSQA
jgi:uncharacterized membrane protein